MCLKDRFTHSASFKIAVTVFILIVAASAYPQSFGKNKVQYQNFDWKFIQSEHFDIYYYEGGRQLAEFTAEIAESSYVSLKEQFNYVLIKRVPIVVYNGHNDFEQTNVSNSMLTESVEGFTEIFKDRVVVQFRGNNADYRHLVHHELSHAVMLQVLYGGGVGSMVRGMARFQVPLWVMEGFAEYASIGWDTESDMFIRDATINGYLPPISQMYGFLNYKGGQSVLNYMADKYGEPKVSEFLSKMRAHRSVDQGLKKSIGMNAEDLTKKWHKHLRKTYWPDIGDREEPEDVGKRLTDHVKDRHFLNNSPSLSPKGDKLVYLSNRTDYIDIYMMNTIDGKRLGRLVKGERSDLFEELHWPRPGIDWSPDGKKIVFAAKAASEDALFILDVKKKKVLDDFRFQIDGVFSPSWSPDGKHIVFMGIDGGQSDLYIFNLDTKKLQKLTNDVFSDMDPRWSPDGREIVFVSDRDEFTDLENIPQDIQNYGETFTDIYTLDVRSRAITRYTHDEAEEISPAFSPDGRKIAYASDASGIKNIYIHDRDSGNRHPITNLLTGVSQISWSREGSRLAFASFYAGGYDIYLLNNPLEIKPGSIDLKKTAYVQRIEEEEAEDAVLAAKTEKVVPPEEPSSYKNFVFGDAFRRGEKEKKEKKQKAFLDSADYKTPGGEYKTNKYKIRFTPDYVSGAAGYSQFFGLQGTSQIVLSDILGNHQISVYTDLFYNLKNSNFQFGYAYLPNRIDMGISVFHYSYLWYTYFSDGQYLFPGYIQDRNYGVAAFMSRPFNRFQRLDLGITGLAIDRNYGELDYWGFSGDFMNELGNLYKRRVAMVNLSYSEDTVLWGMTGPVNGGRSSITATYSPSISKTYGLSFYSARADWRKYYRIRRDYTLALRVAGGASGGKNPQRYLLGGMRGWVNYQYGSISERDWGEDLFYFSTFETPLRGSLYYDLIGTRYVLANLEFRFPLIQYLILGWPLPLGFQNIRGVVFMDVGSAWYADEKWDPVSTESLGLFRLNDEQAAAGFGFGARLNIGYFLLKYDVAWKTDFASTAKTPVHYFTFGAEF